MRISRRRFGALTLAGGATFLLAACSQIGGGTRTGGGTGGGGAVTFVTGLAEDERQVVGDLLKQFEKDAGLQVKMVQMESQDVVNQLKAKKTANKMDVDLIAQDNLRLGPLVREGIVEDLSGEQAHVPDTTIEALVPVTQFDGKRYFFPYRPNVQIAYFNADKLNGYSLKPPETWNDLLKVAQTLKEKEGVGKVAIQGSAGDALTVTVFEFIKQAGGDPLVLNDAGSVKAFEFMAKLEPLMTPEYRTAKFDTMNTILSNDTAYLGSNWPFGITVIVEKNGRKDIKAYHGWKGPAKESHVLGGEVLGIPVGRAEQGRRAQGRRVPDVQGDAVASCSPSSAGRRCGPMRSGSVPDWQSRILPGRPGGAQGGGRPTERAVLGGRQPRDERRLPRHRAAEAAGQGDAGPLRGDDPASEAGPGRLTSRFGDEERAGRSSRRSAGPPCAASQGRAQAHAGAYAFTNLLYESIICFWAHSWASSIAILSLMTLLIMSERVYCASVTSESHGCGGGRPFADAAVLGDLPHLGELARSPRSRPWRGRDRPGRTGPRPTWRSSQVVGLHEVLERRRRLVGQLATS